VKDFRAFDYDVIVQNVFLTLAEFSVTADGMPLVQPEDGFNFSGWDRVRMHRDVAVFVYDNAYDLRKMREDEIGRNFGLARAGVDSYWNTLTSDEDRASDRLEQACRNFPKLAGDWSVDHRDMVIF
jgi:hypothetical protein